MGKSDWYTHWWVWILMSLVQVFLQISFYHASVSVSSSFYSCQNDKAATPWNLANKRFFWQYFLSCSTKRQCRNQLEFPIVQLLVVFLNSEKICSCVCYCMLLMQPSRFRSPCFKDHFFTTDVCHQYPINQNSAALISSHSISRTLMPLAVLY
jgi:hypothetical protein